MKPGPKPSTSKLTKKQKKLTNQYLSGLKRSIERIDSQSFDYYPVKLSNTRLLKFLIGQAYIKKEFLPDMVEKLIIRGLRTDASYQDYQKNDLRVCVDLQPILRFIPKTRITTAEECQKGHSETTAT